MEPHTELGLWEYLEADPEKLLSSALTVACERMPLSTASSYPFKAELNKDPVKEGEVVLVDMSGGRGHALERVTQWFPGLKGRLVL